MAFFVTKKAVQFDDGISIGKVIVYAERVPKDTVIVDVCPKTHEIIQAEAGEWLVEFPSGAMLPLSDRMLRRRFEKFRDEKGMAYAMPKWLEAKALKGGGRLIAKELAGHS